MRATALRGALRGVKTQLHRATAAAASQVQRQLTRWCRAAQPHKNTLTLWEVQCQHGCFWCCSFRLPSANQCQPRIRIHFEIRLSWRLQNRQAPSDLHAPRIKRRGLIHGTDCHLEFAECAHVTGVPDWVSGPRRTIHWFSSHDSYYSRGLTHSCELPHAERDLCANNMTVRNSASSADKFPAIPLIMNVTHTELAN